MKRHAKFFAGVVGAGALLLASQAPAQLETDLVVYLNFDETSGTTLADSSGNGLNADVIGSGVTLGQTGVAGGAAEVPGTVTDFIVIDDNPGNAASDALPAALDLPAEFSLSVWISFPAAPAQATGNNIPMGSCDWGAASAARRGVGFIRKNEGSAPQGHDLIRIYNDAATYPIHFANEEIFDNEAYDGFHHYVLTSEGVEGGNVIWYRDNVPRTNLVGPSPGGYGGTAPWTFGANAGNPTAANMLPDRAVFDDFAIWTRALTPTEVQAIFDAGQLGNPLPINTAVDSWELFY